MRRSRRGYTVDVTFPATCRSAPRRREAGAVALAGLPPEAFAYRLGNRSAVECVIDKYQVGTDKRSGITSDPNRPDDEQYIVRLVGQVVRVSVETVRIVSALPAEFAGRSA